MRAEALEIVFASDQIPLGIRSAPSRSLSRVLFSWVSLLSLRHAYSRARALGSHAAAELVDLELGRSCGDGETSKALRKIFVVLTLIRGGDSVLHSLLETYLFVAFAGLLEHAMLPAEISLSGLNTLLLYGCCHSSKSSNRYCINPLDSRIFERIDPANEL